jgi:hypothetical protein
MELMEATGNGMIMQDDNIRHDGKLEKRMESTDILDVHDNQQERQSQVPESWRTGRINSVMIGAVGDFSAGSFDALQLMEHNNGCLEMELDNLNHRPNSSSMRGTIGATVTSSNRMDTLQKLKSTIAEVNSIDGKESDGIKQEELQEKMWTTVVHRRSTRHQAARNETSVFDKIKQRQKQKQVQKSSKLNSITKINDTTNLTITDNNLNNNLNNNNNKNKIRHEHQSSFILRSQAHSKESVGGSGSSTGKRRLVLSLSSLPCVTTSITTVGNVLHVISDGGEVKPRSKNDGIANRQSSSDAELSAADNEPTTIVPTSVAQNFVSLHASANQKSVKTRLNRDQKVMELQIGNHHRMQNYQLQTTNQLQLSQHR